MGKKVILILSAAVIITAAVFFALNNRYSKQDAAEAAVYEEMPDYLALETDEVIRIKKLRIEGYFNTSEPEPAVTVKKAPSVKKENKQPEKQKKIPEPVKNIEQETVPPLVEPAPEVAVIQKNEPDEIIKEEKEEVPEEKSDIWTDKELFLVKTPENKGFYRKKVFVSGKTLDTELESFKWKTEDGKYQEIETDYAGEFGFYIPSNDLRKRLKIYITAVKNEESRHEKILVLFNRNVKPEIIIEKPLNNYRFGKYLVVKGKINIPGHQGYISDLLEESLISISPAGYEDKLLISKKGEFKYVADTSELELAGKQKLLINAFLNNHKSGSSSIEILKSDYDLVDYEITAGDSSISFSWDEIPVDASYRINISSSDSANKIINNIKSPVKLGSLINSTVYKVQIEAEETETGEILTGRKESVLPLDPVSIKPSAEGFFGRVKIKWPHVKGADKYMLFKKALRSNNNETLLEHFSGSSFTDENVTPAERYSYSVQPSELISVRSFETVASPSTGAEKKIHEIKNLVEADRILNVFIVNNYAYSLTDKKIIISDISDIDNPLYVGEISEKADSIAVDEEYCYIISEESGFVLYNISNPSLPVQIVRREQYKGKNIWTRFPFVYISETDKGIRVLDITQPEMPAKKTLYSSYFFSSMPVISREEKSYMTAYDINNNIAVFNIEPEGKLTADTEIKTEVNIRKAQSSFINGSIITAVMTAENEIILFSQNPENRENKLTDKHLIESIGITDFNFYSAHSGRSYLAVEKINSADLYSLNEKGEPSFFTSVKKDADEYLSFCHDNSGFAYIVKSQNNIEIYRIMTEGVSYINNSFKFPDKIHDFDITDSIITALTDNGIFSSDRNSYFPEAELISDGSYRRMWSTPYYTAAITKKYDYELFLQGNKTALTVESGGIKGVKAESSGDYSVILNEDNEVLVFSFDITKNAPLLIAETKRENINNIFAFSDENSNYAGMIFDNHIEILEITEDNGFIKTAEAEIEVKEKINNIKHLRNKDTVDINLYSDNIISSYKFTGGLLQRNYTEKNSNSAESVFGDLTVVSEGEEGISIYKNIDGRRILVSRCSGVFSFDTEYFDGRIYSRGFNTVDEIIPVIPVWFR